MQQPAPSPGSSPGVSERTTVRLLAHLLGHTPPSCPRVGSAEREGAWARLEAQCQALEVEQGGALGQPWGHPPRAPLADGKVVRPPSPGGEAPCNDGGSLCREGSTSYYSIPEELEGSGEDESASEQRGIASPQLVPSPSILNSLPTTPGPLAWISRVGQRLAGELSPWRQGARPSPSDGLAPDIAQYASPVPEAARPHEHQPEPPSPDPCEEGIWEEEIIDSSPVLRAASRLQGCSQVPAPRAGSPSPDAQSAHVRAFLSSASSSMDSGDEDLALPVVSQAVIRKGRILDSSSSSEEDEEVVDRASSPSVPALTLPTVLARAPKESPWQGRPSERVWGRKGVTVSRDPEEALLTELASELQGLDVTKDEGKENVDAGLGLIEGRNDAPPTTFPWEVDESTPWRKALLPTGTPESAIRRNGRVAEALPSKKPACVPFALVRERLALELLAQFDVDIFGSVLGPVTEVKWSRTLNKTAGRTQMILLTNPAPDAGALPLHRARIELSTKVLDCEARLRNTLAHEMCHAAVWVIERTSKQPHGPLFQAWGRRCEAVYADLEIRTSHTYEIAYRYRYRCTNPLCNRVFGRHSKSINVQTHGCGYCRSKLQLEA